MNPTIAADDPRLRVVDDPTQVDAAHWNALLAAQAQPTPFVRLEYLRALHASGSAVPETGWGPRLLCLYRGDELIAACPAYVKAHSWGEYVFDWAWADAYRRHGLRYYPKLVCAVPFTPVPGSRLLARDDAARLLLLEALRQWAQDGRLSSAHLLFLGEADRRCADTAGWLMRRTVQFHWNNRSPQPYASFDEFVRSLHRDKRKKIAQERRRVADAGVGFQVHAADAIDDELWDFFYTCYARTYAEHHSTPYLSREFFLRTHRDLPGLWTMFVASRGGRRIAASLIAVDRARGHAWGRYWGSHEYLPCLHFEACYYQPLAWCIANGLRCFEGGAQGEHKMARGLMPVVTYSAHWLAQPAFADAVARYLEREGDGIGDYVDELRERSPYRGDAAG